jgi:hypothetical protein
LLLGVDNEATRASPSASSGSADNFVVAYQSNGSAGNEKSNLSVQATPEPSFVRSLGEMLAMVSVLERRRQRISLALDGSRPSSFVANRPIATEIGRPRRVDHSCSRSESATLSSDLRDCGGVVALAEARTNPASGVRCGS